MEPGKSLTAGYGEKASPACRNPLFGRFEGALFRAFGQMGWDQGNSETAWNVLGWPCSNARVCSHCIWGC